MNTFKKKSLYAALAGVGALGLTGAADAVNVNPNGLGQVLIYPYYTVRTTAGGNAFNTLLSVVNTTASAKAVKVRFLEGKNSREVLDFNLFLSPRDVWTAAVVPTASGAGVTTSDKSCTAPPITGTVGFVNYAYASDPAGGSLDRTREGYVEIIEMADLSGAAATAATHVNGVPPGCDLLQSANFAQTGAVVGQGGLFGDVQMVNVAAGAAAAAPAVALIDWNATNATITEPADIRPTLDQANPPITVVYGGGSATTYTFAAPIDAVSAALMHNTAMNEIIQDTGTKSSTDFIITFPTKRFYVTTAAALPPFQRAFTSSGSCDDVLIQIWDREERTGSTPANFSPPLSIPNTALCWEANVLTFSNTGSTPTVSNVLGSTNFANINTASIVSGYQNGWARIDLANATSGAISSHKLVSLEGATFVGLPVIGSSAFNYINDVVVPGLRSTYGLSFPHRYTSLVR